MFAHDLTELVLWMLTDTLDEDLKCCLAYTYITQLLKSKQNQTVLNEASDCVELPSR